MCLIFGLFNCIIIYMALRTFDYLVVDNHGVHGSIHKSFHIKPISFDLPWNDISKVLYAPGTKLRFVLTICTNRGLTYEVCSDNIGKSPDKLLEALLIYHYVHLEHYWKQDPIKEDISEHIHVVKEGNKGEYSYFVEPFILKSSNSNVIDPFWKEYLLLRKYSTKHILNICGSLLKHISKSHDNIEFVDFIRRIMVFCLIQDMRYKEARDELKLLSNTLSNKKYIEAEIQYMDNAKCIL